MYRRITQVQAKKLLATGGEFYICGAFHSPSSPCQKLFKVTPIVKTNLKQAVFKMRAMLPQKEVGQISWILLNSHWKTHFANYKSSMTPHYYVKN